MLGHFKTILILILGFTTFNVSTFTIVKIVICWKHIYILITDYRSNYTILFVCANVLYACMCALLVLCM